MRVVFVSVGRPQQVAERGGRPIMSAIGKAPVDGRVRVSGVNVDGDVQADRRVHGGPDKAVYAYAAEDIAWWSARLARPLRPGAFGENLTLAGVDVTNAVIGERWRIGTVELQVCQPRQPCFKLGLRFGDPLMLRHFARAGRPGAYLRILSEGEVGAGDRVDISDRPSHGVTIHPSGRRDPLAWFVRRIAHSAAGAGPAPSRGPAPALGPAACPGGRECRAAQAQTHKSWDVVVQR